MKDRHDRKTKAARITRRRALLGILMVILVAAIAFFSYQVIQERYNAAEHARLMETLRAQRTSEAPATPAPSASPAPTPTAGASPTPTQTPEPTPTPAPSPLQAYAAHVQQYPDFAGWIRMPALKGMDYPVLQTTDNDYYLTHGIDGEKTVYGSMFMDYRNNRMDLGDNTILYGHNMRDGSMLGQLKKYKEKSFALSEEARTLFFDTPYAQYTWKVFSVYVVDITKNLDFYRIRFKGEDAFNAYIDAARARSLVDYSDVQVEYGDKLLSLYTCDAAGDDYRLILHAVLVKEP